MQHGRHIETVFAMMVLCGSLTCTAQEINLWRGGEVKADWNDPYKWKLLHVPSGDEAVHFRQTNSVITVSSTIELDNGMMLYGRDLFLEGHGNINLWSPVPHKGTVNIPASATGQAHLTLSDTLALNGRIALAANPYGTSDSKGSVTLNDQSSITGNLLIGSNGNGSGQVFILDQSTYRISGLELHTLAENGGTAELHILGGSAHLEADTKPFEAFLADPGRKIIIDEAGTLRVDSDWPIQRKKEMISELISKKRIIAARNCQLTLPVIEKNMILFKAEFTGNPQPIEALLAEIEEIQPPQRAELVENELSREIEKPADTAEDAPAKPKISKLETLLQDMRTNREPETIVAIALPESVVEDIPEPPSCSTPVPFAGYIVFFSAFLFFIRPQKSAD